MPPLQSTPATHVAQSRGQTKLHTGPSLLLFFFAASSFVSLSLFLSLYPSLQKLFAAAQCCNCSKLQTFSKT